MVHLRTAQKDTAMSRRRTERPPRSPLITPEGLRALQQEYDRLWKHERPRVTREVAAAAALGDRSENAEYIYGKKRLREIDGRLEFLTHRMNELRVVFGAWVRLADESGGELLYRLVGPDEFDVDAGLISVDSPVGRALLGRCEGDEVVVRRPKGDAVFEILEVRYS
jgi:transcription elongation factor GreB